MSFGGVLLVGLVACGTNAPADTTNGAARGDETAVASKSAVTTETARALPAETDLPYAGAGTWTLGGVTLTLADTMLRANGAVVLANVYHAPLAGPDVLWVPADPGAGDGGIYAVRVADGVASAIPLVTGGMPDRLVRAPDGATLLFVSGRSGLTSVWSVPTIGGQARQLTNVGLAKPVGHAPDGFVPPWERAAPRFSGDVVRWEARGAAWEAAWR